MATIVAAAGGGNWTLGATWVGGVVPSLADNVQLTSTSGSVIINAAAACRSLDCNTYTGVLTHSAAVTLTVGDATSGTGNIALRCAAGMTYIGSTGTISFASSSATVQTITLNGKTLSTVIFGQTVSGSWQLTDTFSCSGILTLMQGTLDTNNQTATLSSFVSNNAPTRTVKFGSSAITLTSTSTAVLLANIATMTFFPNTAIITLTGANATLGLGGINTNGTSFVLSHSTSQAISGNGSVVANLTRISSVAGGALSVQATSILITGTLTLTGSSAYPLLVSSNTPGTARTLNAANVVLSNVDFADITAAGAASFAGTSIGDALGNSNITFSTAVTRYAVSPGNWSSTSMWSASSGGAAGASVPLCHDSVILDANSAAGTYAADVARIGKDVTCTGFTRTLQFAFSVSLYGSLFLISGMTLSSGIFPISFLGRSIHSITSAGKAFGGNATITAPGGTYSLSDAFTTGSLLSVQFGTFVTNNFNILSNSAIFNTPSTVNLGTSTITLQGGGTVFTNTTGGGSIFNSSTIVIGLASASSRAFVGSGSVYGTLTYTVAGSTGALALTGANTFSTINFSDSTNARTLTLPSSTVTKITNAFNVQGTSGKLMAINSSSSGTAATISKPNGQVSCNFLSITDSSATGGARWYAGVNSTSISNVSGWIFSQPTSPNFFALFD